MNTNEIVSHLAANNNMSKAEARRMLDAFVDTLTTSLGNEQGFSLPEIGTFDVNTREERQSYNPYQKKYMILPPKRVVRFHPNQDLKEAVK
ncbi:MAG TPA: HU family DNA-binding protein [Balneolaceae bacterium]|nr:HU family DNA-binding protein [Balneolaceae bacterium]